MVNDSLDKTVMVADSLDETAMTKDGLDNKAMDNNNHSLDKKPTGNDSVDYEHEQGQTPEETLEKDETIISFLQSFNRFATKKTLGQGALDLALLAANITKLTSVLDREKKDGVYYVLIVAISISIGLQLVVGVLMGIIGKMKLKTEDQRRAANILNNVITVLVSVICVINIALSVLDVSAPITKIPAT